MVADGIGHRRRQLVVQSVIAAHDPLELGELADHAADQIGLAQARRDAHLLRIGSRDELRDLLGQLPDTFDALRLRAELGVEDDMLQRRQPLFQALLAVVVPEELGIRQARAQDTLVTADDGRTAIARHVVGDHDEAVGERAVLPAGGEVALMRLHRHDQHLGRHVHELGVDGAEQRHRPFDQTGNLLEQALVGPERHLSLGAEPLRTVEHDLLAFGRIQHDVRRPELGRVVGET